MLKVISKGLWSVIAAKSRQAATRRAAIAYLGDSPPVSFKNGDLLVVDASDPSIKSGRTSAKVLHDFYKDGAELRSHSNLHAKVMLLDEWAVIGSANASRRSADTYIEAAVITDRPDVASQVEQLISELAKYSKPINASFLKRISALPVTRAPFTPGGRQKPLAPVIQGRDSVKWCGKRNRQRYVLG